MLLRLVLEDRLDYLSMRMPREIMQLPQNLAMGQIAIWA